MTLSGMANLNSEAEPPRSSLEGGRVPPVLLAAMVAAGVLRGVSVVSGQVEVRLSGGERGRTVSSRASTTQRWVRGMKGSAVEVLLGRLEGVEWPG